MIHIDNTAVISEMADIEDSIRGSRIVIGAHTQVDSFVKIKPAGGLGDLVVGSNCVINSGTVLYTGNGISIGNHVLIAANCTLAPTNHEYRSKRHKIADQGFMSSKGGIVIEDDVWIGANCTLLDGSIIRRGCVVSASSVVCGELPEYSVCRGRPALPFRYRY